MRVTSERAVRGWSRDQTERATAAVVAADRHRRIVGVVGNRILMIVALGNQCIVLACGIVGSLWGIGRRAADRTRRVDNWQTGTVPASVSGTVAAAIVVVAGRIVECIRWDLYLRNRSTVAAAAAAVAVASQRSIVVRKDQEEEIRHLCLGSEKRHCRCDL